LWNQFRPILEKVNQLFQLVNSRHNLLNSILVNDSQFVGQLLDLFQLMLTIQPHPMVVGHLVVEIVSLTHRFKVFPTTVKHRAALGHVLNEGWIESFGQSHCEVGGLILVDKLELNLTLALATITIGIL